ncbi:nose resistant to fluoxetine protein 6-like isoform X2 [Parasteatoda tepidariorum]|uniref:nose resistant to fluoxetine protein 6-like isoform X2 n=1 Tax=Parasteatoda tepidariorum TaxID=114398 RepID=UPI0039BD1580
MEMFIYTLFIVLICLLVLGTSLDILFRNKPKRDFHTNNKSAAIKALLCFSAYTNTIRLLKVDENPDTLHIFHGLRVLSITWIIWSHSYLVGSHRAFDGAFRSISLGKEFIFQTVPCGFLAVENFFFMRLTPTMMLVVAFFAIIGRFGSGPLWKEIIVDSLSKNCLERGWMNLFYVNNIFFSPKMCLAWTWYISADTQIFLVSLYICTIMRRWPGRGLFLAGLVIVMGVFLSACSHLYYKLPPTYLLNYLNRDDWFFYLAKGYTPAHFHIPVSAVGLIVGYILATKRGHIPKLINAIGWFLSFMTFLSIMILTYKWNQGTEHQSGLFVSTLYGCTHRLAWTLCLAFMTLSCTWGQGGIINGILSWEGFVPFARLSYLVYLVHYGLVRIYTGSIRQSMLLGHRTMIFIFFNNMILSFLTAFMLGLVFESPLMALEKAFLDGKLRKEIMPVNAVNGIVIRKKSE